MFMYSFIYINVCNYLHLLYTYSNYLHLLFTIVMYIFIYVLFMYVYIYICIYVLVERQDAPLQGRRQGPAPGPRAPELLLIV